VTPVLQDVLFHNLLDLLQAEDAQKHFKRDNLVMPRISALKTKEKNRRRKARLAVEVLKQQGVMSSLATENSLLVSHATNSRKEKVESQEKPFLCGLNSVTRQMESLIRSELSKDTTAVVEKDNEPTSYSLIKHRPTIIFVCQADVDPPTLVSHFPLLCATYNAVMNEDVYLIKLPADSESKLSEAASLRRCSVLSVDANTLSQESDAGTSLRQILAKLKDSAVETMRLNWLDNSIAAMRGQDAPPIKLMEPRVKHMRSSALLDMNAVKAEKKAARKAAIQARRSRRISDPQGLKKKQMKSQQSSKKKAKR
jgi:ribonuclease P/MRP protein subunit POP3